jgi:hypothetical protein
MSRLFLGAQISLSPEKTTVPRRPPPAEDAIFPWTEGAAGINFLLLTKERPMKQFFSVTVALLLEADVCYALPPWETAHDGMKMAVSVKRANRAEKTTVPLLIK